MPLNVFFSQWGLNPIKLAYDPYQPNGWLIYHPASSRGNRAYCYSELTISSIAMAMTTASIHCAYPGKDGQAELSRVSE